MSKPQKTAGDYMLLTLSPILIMVLVGSLCFFLIEVFYRGKMMGSVCWVMFWFVIGIVLVSRIAIENSTEYAAMYGLGLALATCFYMYRTQPSVVVGAVLLAVVWFCAHKLVWDCTLIDDEQDSSGQGLLQKSAAPAIPKKTMAKKTPRKISGSGSPGRWVIYFSLAALPLFGFGQMLLPGDSIDRRAGFIFLALYLGAALGLLLTTSFLGLRRYLRQRYLKMPATIAMAWLKFGVGVALIVLVGAVFLPRPGANEAWTALRYQIDYQISKASQYASGHNPPGTGEGHPGNDTGGKNGEASTSNPPKPEKAPSSGQPKPGQGPQQTSSTSAPQTGPPGQAYNLLRVVFFGVVALVIGGWIFRRRHLFLAMLRSMIVAITDFLKKLFGSISKPKSVKKNEIAAAAVPQFSSFAQYKNPFFATKDYAWPPEQIILYSYEAVQVWAREQGVAPRPEETAREFCNRLGGTHEELSEELNSLARLYAYAAYGRQLAANSDLEPIRELWRKLPTVGIGTGNVVRA